MRSGEAIWIWTLEMSVESLIYTLRPPYQCLPVSSKMVTGLSSSSSTFTSRPREWSSLTRTLKDSGMVGSSTSLPLRSEEHTSELQSRGHLVCRLLLEKKKIQIYQVD